MTDTKWTPGPWWFEVRHGHSSGPRYVVTGNDIDRIAVISERGGAEDPLSHANLIAAAPELYEALMQVLDSDVYADGEGLINVGVSGYGDEAFEMARKALAKARGEEK